MREALRGYAAALLEPESEQQLRSVAAQLAAVRESLRQVDGLLGALGDDALPVSLRLAIVTDLVGQAHPIVQSLLTFVVRSDAAGELLGDLEWLVGRAQQELDRHRGGPEPDPPAGHSAVNERLEGYALASFASDGTSGDRAALDEVEDELFRFTRILDANRDLRESLSDPTRPAALREGILTDLLTDRVQPVTLRLLGYAVRQTRGQLSSHLDWLVERVAEERGRRTAEVSAAVDLDAGQRSRLAEALSRLTGRQVSLQVSVEPDLIGGVRVVVGDTVLDATVRRRLDQVHAVLAQSSRRVSRDDERQN